MTLSDDAPLRRAQSLARGSQRAVAPPHDPLIDGMKRALWDELQAARQGPSLDPTRLVRGRRVGRFGDFWHYEFEAERTLPKTLVEDVDAELRVAERPLKVRVVRHAGLALTLAAAEDLGKHVTVAELVWDLTFLLEKLADRLEERRGRENRYGDLLLGRLNSNSATDRTAFDGLNDGQDAAVSHALASECTFIWGPPGTGKTRTIGWLVAELVRRGRSVLLVSHTNVAIDEALLRSADALGDDLPDGEVLRLGRAFGPALAQRPRLLTETHVKEREAEVKEAIEHVYAARAELRSRAMTAYRAVELADWVGGLRHGRGHLERLEREIERAENDLRSAEELLDKQARGLLGPSRLNRDSDVANALRRLCDARSKWRTIADELADVPARHGVLPRDSEGLLIGRLEHARSAAAHMLSEVHLAEAKATVEADRPKLAAFERRISTLRAQMEHIENELVDEAQVVACTLTAAYLRRAVAGRSFDTVIIDEASIAPIPSAWYAANLAERAVVAVGDFRQLAPIALTETTCGRRWLQRDVFEESGVRTAYERGDKPSYLLPLTVQHRMASPISVLPNKLAYGGMLSDAPAVNDDSELDGWFDMSSGATAAVTVVDVGNLRTWATTIRRGARSSRTNVLSAAAAVDVMQGMLSADRPEPPESAPRRGIIIAPYRPQAELLGAMLRARRLDDEVLAGTIHAFQGSEASTVVLDMTVAEPHYRAAIFSPDFDEAHRRMLNVAVTRARRRLVVVLDSAFIRQHAARSTATDQLRRMLIGARAVPSADVVRSAPEDVVLEALARAERDVVWFVDDPDAEPRVGAAVAAAARRGVTVCVVTASGRQRQLGLNVAELTRQRAAGSAIFLKWPLREALVIVDDRFVAIRARGVDGWSAWDDPAVAAFVSKAQQVPLLTRLAASEAGGACARCGDLVELREGDHAGAGVYARCSGCGRRAGA
jgi:glycerol-3-phosphate cytidylyltransferase-like family protein